MCIRDRFVRAVREAVRLIAQDPEGEAFLEKWAAREAEYGAL